MFIEQDYAASSLPARSQKLNRLVAGEHGRRIRIIEKVGGGFGHHNAHDGFTVTRSRSSAGFSIGITAAADQTENPPTRRGACSRCRLWRWRRISGPLDR